MFDERETATPAPILDAVGIAEVKGQLENFVEHMDGDDIDAVPAVEFGRLAASGIIPSLLETVEHYRRECEANDAIIANLTEDRDKYRTAVNTIAGYILALSMVPKPPAIALAVAPAPATPREHDYADAEPSNSGKRGWRCRACGHYTNAPVKAQFDPCPGVPAGVGTDTKCPRCGDHKTVSDFDPDLGTWRRCKQCEYEWPVVPATGEGVEGGR